MLLPGLACLVILIFLAITRHIQLVSRRCPKRRPKQPSYGDHGDNEAQGSHTVVRRKPTDYYLFVLGSGGHTKEMLMMMDDGFCDFTNFHRRYLVSSGDSLSKHQVAEYEDSLKLTCRKQGHDIVYAGSHDIVTVTRARRVHQSLWSAPLTTLLSLLDIFPALLRPPKNQSDGRVRLYPSMVFSNGPGTGFSVALAIYFMKLLFYVPEDCMRFVYIESWARITTLSLTGKMLYYSGLADVFVTQHRQVADRYGVYNVGEMVFNARRERFNFSAQ